MARGWESKAVEDQQLERERRRDAGRGTPAPDRALAQQRRSLELARARANADLAGARNEVHREMLRQAVAALDAQLAALGEP